jgi:hypothetical protein
MDEKVERTLKEIEQRIERLRAGLADLSEALQHAALARASYQAKLARDLQARREQVSELERRATAGADRLTES